MGRYGEIWAHGGADGGAEGGGLPGDMGRYGLTAARMAEGAEGGGLPLLSGREWSSCVRVDHSDQSGRPACRTTTLSRTRVVAQRAS